MKKWKLRENRYGVAELRELGLFILVWAGVVWADHVSKGWHLAWLVGMWLLLLAWKHSVISEERQRVLASRKVPGRIPTGE